MSHATDFDTLCCYCHSSQPVFWFAWGFLFNPTWSLKVCCSPSKRLEFSRYFHIIDLWSNFVIIQNILHDFNSFVLREVCFLAQNMVQRSTCLWKRRVICRRRTDEVGRHCFYGPISRLLAETPREGGRSPRPHRGSLCFSFPV